MAEKERFELYLNSSIKLFISDYTWLIHDTPPKASCIIPNPQIFYRTKIIKKYVDIYVAFAYTKYMR